MKVTLAQFAPKLAKDNIQTHLDIINKHKSQSDLIVFPELSLHGYLLQDKVYEDAYTLTDLSVLIEASKEVDIIIGLALKEEKAIYNSALYLSGGTVLHTHHKNHLANYGMFEEARYFFKGEVTQSFQTDFGESMVLVCEDLWRASIVAKVADYKPKYLFVIANSPARDFEEKELLIQSQWQALLKSTALLSGTTVVFVNRTGFEDGLGFWGGSCVISADAKVIHQLELFKENIKTVDIKAGLFEAKKMIMKHG